MNTYWGDNFDGIRLVAACAVIFGHSLSFGRRFDSLTGRRRGTVRLPVGEGLLSFQNLEEAAANLLEVLGNYDRHCREAAQVASEYFDYLLERSYSSASSLTSLKASEHPETKVV